MAFCSSQWCIELTLIIEPVEPIIAGTIEENRAGRARNEWALMKAGLTIPAPDHIKELAIRHIRFKRLKLGKQIIEVIAHRTIAVDQFRIKIAEHPAITQVALIPQKEEERAATNKWLMVAGKVRGEARCEFRQQLAFPAGPLQKRTYWHQVLQGAELQQICWAAIRSFDYSIRQRWRWALQRDR